MTTQQGADYIAGMESDDRKAMLYGGITLIVTFLIIWFAYVGMQRDTKRICSAPIEAGCTVHNETNQWGWPEEHTICK